MNPDIVFVSVTYRRIIKKNDLYECRSFIKIKNIKSK